MGAALTPGNARIRRGLCVYRRFRICGSSAGAIAQHLWLGIKSRLLVSGNPLFGRRNFVMTLTLYPYVYLLARVAFVQQSVCILEVSRTLGKTAWQSFFSIALPSARPSLFIGVSLVLMETLNDFGTVDFFAVETLTAGIFDVWLNLNNLSGAAHLPLSRSALSCFFCGRRGNRAAIRDFTILPPNIRPSQVTN